ncbi:FtsK/SpoIIIE domain-containing protein [Glutamicibacter sp. 363]|uniref:FtsK/SpoIIIE domain-containing protein n=1 Tax=Glutamicibacter sp. 363 TaxID=3457731 RepID=UPI004034222E
MARRRPSSAPKPKAVLFTVLGFTLMFVLLWFGLPSVPALWLGLLIGAITYPPFQYTGKKDKSGKPTPLDDSERTKMQKFRFWQDMRTSIFFKDAFTPGINVLLSWIGSLMIAVAGLWVPVSFPGDGGAFMNALFTFITLTGLHGSRRRTKYEDDVNPGVRFSALIQLFKSSERNTAIGLGIGGLIGGMVIASVINIFRPVYEAVFTAPTWSLYLIFGLGLPLLLLGLRVRKEAIKQWQIVVNAREEWRPRWQMLNHDPAPKLINRQILGKATLDTFLAPQSVGAQKYTSMESQIAPTIGGGMIVHTLETHDSYQDGRPIPGSRSPLKFEVASWFREDDPDVGSSTTPFEFVELKARCALAKACDEGKLNPRFVFEGISPITVAPDSKASSPVSSSVEGQVVAWSDPDANTQGPALEKGEDADDAPMIYQLHWSHHDGADSRSFLELANDEFELAIGTQAVTDHRADDGNGCLYFGELTAEVDFVENSPVTGEDLDRILGEMEWAKRWRSASSKLGANPPRPEWDLQEFSTLASGAVIESLPFVTREGVTPAVLFDLEKELPTVLDAAPFVSMTGFQAPQAGDRHPMGIVVRHSNDHSIPTSPESLAPASGEKAPEWVLAGLLNRAFKSARLARPELISATCLTHRRARKHIWKMEVALYDGVVFEEVLARATKLKVALGCSWLRIAQHAKGCTIVAGGTPNHDDLEHPDSDEKYLEQLNWNQHFIDAGFYGQEGRLPQITSVSVLPYNKDVHVFEFSTANTGIVFSTFKGKVEKLKTVTENSWVDPLRNSKDPTKVTLRVCKTNPIPELARYDFDYIDSTHKLPFATGVEGTPLELDFKVSPHLLCLGATGGGKSVILQAYLFSALLRGYELIVIDPSKGGADFKFAEPYTSAFTGDIEEARAIIRALYEEVKRVKDLNAQYGVGNYRDLPNEVRPKHRVILIDEFTSLMARFPVPAETDDPDAEEERQRIIQENSWRAEIGTFVGRIAREARSAGFSLILATQKLSAKIMENIPGGEDLKTNMARAIVGNASNGELMSALRQPFGVPKLGDEVPKGRGLYEPLSSVAMPMQVWFEPEEQSKLGFELERRIIPLVPHEKLDISRYMEQGTQTVAGLSGDSAGEPKIELLDAGEIFAGFDWEDLESADEDNVLADQESPSLTASELDVESLGENTLSLSAQAPGVSEEDDLESYLAELEMEGAEGSADTEKQAETVVVHQQVVMPEDASRGTPYVAPNQDMIIPEPLTPLVSPLAVEQPAVQIKPEVAEALAPNFDRLSFENTLLVMGVEGVLLPTRPKGKTKSFSTSTRGRTRYRPEVVDLLVQNPNHMVLCKDEDDAQELREKISHQVNFVPAGEYMRQASVYMLKSRRRMKAHTILVVDQRLLEPSETPDMRWVDVIGSYLHRPGRIHARYIEVEASSGISVEHLHECILWLGDMTASDPGGVIEYLVTEPDARLSEMVTGAKSAPQLPSTSEGVTGTPEQITEPPVGYQEPIEFQGDVYEPQVPAQDPVQEPEAISANTGYTAPGDDW